MHAAASRAWLCQVRAFVCLHSHFCAAMSHQKALQLACNDAMYMVSVRRLLQWQWFKQQCSKEAGAAPPFMCSAAAHGVC